MKLGKTLLLAGALLLSLLPLSACNNNHNTTLDEPNREQDILPQDPVPQNAAYLRVLVDGLNVRSGAGTAYASLGQAEKGVLLKRGEKKNGWYETEYCGKTAFVSADERFIAAAELEKGDTTTEKIIEAGLPFLGTPYVYGAVRLHDGKGHFDKNFTDSEFDCSSLMQYMFYEGAGILLDVNTRTQIKQGYEVKKSEIQRGDLLFFTNASRYYNTGIERVGHVALYLGDNYILHTASDYAKIEQISAKRWSYFLEARRVR